MTVYVCSDRDIACGDNDCNWCSACPKWITVPRNLHPSERKESNTQSTDAKQGWQCPICKSVYSPSQPTCFYCVKTSLKDRIKTP